MANDEFNLHTLTTILNYVLLLNVIFMNLNVDIKLLFRRKIKLFKIKYSRNTNIASDNLPSAKGLF